MNTPVRTAIYLSIHQDFFALRCRGLRSQTSEQQVSSRKRISIEKRRPLFTTRSTARIVIHCPRWPSRWPTCHRGRHHLALSPNQFLPLPKLTEDLFWSLVNSNTQQSQVTKMQCHHTANLIGKLTGNPARNPVVVPRVPQRFVGIALRFQASAYAAAKRVVTATE